MRVLVVDQDSAMNLAIARSLRERFTVDAVTTKGDCLDLLRSNTFEVIVAGERLEDGSGLELLGQISKRWPSILRIFAADPHRLKLLRGRLGPFELFQTLTYPIDPERLLATLTLADAAQDADADTSNIQHVELSGELEAEAEEPDAFPTPHPEPRAAPQGPSSSSQKGSRTAPAPRTPSAQRASSVQQPRRNGAAGGPITRNAAPPAPPGPEPAPLAKRGRARQGSRRPPPVRFPPLEPPQATPAQVPVRNSLAEAAVMAREARSNLNPLPDESDSKLMAILIGAGAIVTLGVVVLGFKLFGSKSQPAARTAAPAIQAPEYPREVTDLVAQIESALKGDDFKGARAHVDQLRQIAPSHPRVAFFENLLAQRSTGSKGGSSETHGGATGHGDKAGVASHHGSSAANTDKTSAAGTALTSGSESPGAASSGDTAASNDGMTRHDATTSRDAAASHEATDAHDAASSRNVALSPETPPGMSVTSTASSAVEAPLQLSAAQTTPSPPAPSLQPAPSESASPMAPSVAPVTPATPSPAPARRVASNEPPPVIQEAKLIRRVNPDYPSSAKREGIKGSVDLDVTVSQQGVVKDASVAHADPADVFDKAALAAVRKWKYDPRFVDGLPAEAHLKVHLDFKPGQ